MVFLLLRLPRANGGAGHRRGRQPGGGANDGPARPEVERGRLLLTFRYGFHFKMAQESASQVEPLVKAWLGQEAGLELRLQEPGSGTAAATPTPRPLAPEEDPLIKAAERKLEGRVVRVRPLKELE